MTQSQLRICVACGRATEHEIVFVVPTFGKVTLPICEGQCEERVSLKTDPFAPGSVRLKVAPDPIFLTQHEQSQEVSGAPDVGPVEEHQ